MNDDDSAH